MYTYICNILEIYVRTILMENRMEKSLGNEMETGTL